jgi:peptide/nickel transport system permease protein
MWRYVVKRLLMLIPVIIGVTLIVFVIISFTPGDPAQIILPDGTDEQIAALHKELGLDDPVIVQFFRYMVNLCRGDMGNSYHGNHDPVLKLYFQRFPATLELASLAMVIAMVLAVPLATISALKQYSVVDNVANVVALIGISIPSFWLGILFILLFALKLGVLPSGGRSVWYSTVLPSFTTGLLHEGSMYRVTRSSVLEIIRQDYITTARAKGIKENQVIRRHMLRNAWIPVVTQLGNEIAGTLAGAVVIENVFSWPGVGRLIIEAFHLRDRPLIVGSLILTTMVISFVTLGVDILYAYLDPRIKAEYQKAAKRKRRAS